MALLDAISVDGLDILQAVAGVLSPDPCYRAETPVRRETAALIASMMTPTARPTAGVGWEHRRP